MAMVAPVTGFLTYLSLLIFTGNSSASKENYSLAATGLLFSAGTFLYVATLHVLPEVYCSSEVHRPSTHPHFPEEHVHDKEHSSKMVELLLLLAGFIAPLGLTTIFVRDY